MKIKFSYNKSTLLIISHIYLTFIILSCIKTDFYIRKYIIAKNKINSVLNEDIRHVDVYIA